MVGVGRKSGVDAPLALDANNRDFAIVVSRASALLTLLRERAGRTEE